MPVEGPHSLMKVPFGAFTIENLLRRLEGYLLTFPPLVAGLRYKPRVGGVAWWQQTSTDMSSDQETDTELDPDPEQELDQGTAG